MGQPALDSGVVDSIRELQMPGGPDLVAQLTNAFLEDGRARLADLRQALSARDHTGVQMAAHSLKGMCGAIGATSMASLSHELEHRAIDAAVDAGLASLIELEFARVEAALRAVA